MLPPEVTGLKPRRLSDSGCAVAGLPPTPPPLPLPVQARTGRLRRSGPRLRCVLVGDGEVGKSSLVCSYTTNGYPAEYTPTARDDFNVTVVVDGHPIRLQLCDTAGQIRDPPGPRSEELERLRRLCYRNADVFLLCYSVVRPASFRNLTQRWVPEVRRFCPAAALVLVGTQLDLREDVQVLIRLAERSERPVGTEEGRQLARELGAAGFAECSALTQKNLKDAFDSAILASIAPADGAGERPGRPTLKEKTPEKIRTLTEAWWRKMGCLVGE